MNSIRRNHTGHRVGQEHGKAKLTDDQVKQIREIRSTKGLSYKKIADMFNCGESTVRDITNYYTRWV